MPRTSRPQPSVRLARRSESVPKGLDCRAQASPHARMATTTTTTGRALALAKRLRSRIIASADGWHFAGSDAAVDFHRARIWNSNGRLAWLRRAGLISDAETRVVR